MRKIPNINKHIFKQPGLVWIAGESVPVDLPEASNVSVSEPSNGVYSLTYTYSGTNSEATPETWWESIDITGTLAQGQVITATVTPSGTYTYQWYRSDDNQGLNEAAISGATANTHTIVAGDIGKRLRVEATDVHGDVYSSYYTESLLSGSPNIHIGFRDSTGSNGAPTALAPATAINDSNIQNGSNGAIADLVDIDGDATGFGLTIGNPTLVGGGNAGTAGDTTLFTQQTKDYYMSLSSSNASSVTIDGLDDSDTFTIRVLHNISNGSATNRGVVLSAGGASGTQKTYTIQSLNEEDAQVLTGLTTDGAGNLIINWNPEDGSDLAVLNALELETE